MNRRVLAVAILLTFTIFPVYWKVYASIDAIQLKSYHSPLLESYLSELPNRELMNSLVYLPASEFSEEEAAQMIHRVSKIPAPILNVLVNQNVHLYLFKGNLTDVQGFEHLQGDKPRGYSAKGSNWENVPGIGGSKLVLAKIGHSNKGMGHGSANLELHELAHSIDRYVLGNVRLNQTYLSIWKEEAHLLFPEKQYFLHFPEEYFAEVFAMYYLNEKSRFEIAKNAPKTFLFLKNLEVAPITKEILLTEIRH
ncbi:anthrax toxin lethal factor-related metalloendopeptidase [Sutcliffiella deserti]|uniref:anthrax toxin lethal factor-related metalloendopeptidase n=1 Tax=Sutcliffiella deserti TaxID=2875501 RepID=UPI001CBD635F|nr:toxin [Sutcliffiella deserti]